MRRIEALMRRFNTWLATPRQAALGAVTACWVTALIAIWGVLSSLPRPPESLMLLARRLMNLVG